MANEYIVAIVEGEKTEKIILENLQMNFFNKKTGNKELIILPFKTNIYPLWKRLKEDDFETNIIDVLIERDEKIKKQFDGIDKSLVSEIYLFFDYDGQAYPQDKGDEIIIEMIQNFDNETEYGKMYISYPMVESIKDINKNDICSRRCFVDAKINIHYKRLVSESKFSDLKRLTLNDWYGIIISNLKKANCIVSSSYTFPKYDEYRDNLNQCKIFDNQLSKFIKKDKSIAVLPGFAFFIIDYFGEDLYKQIRNASNVEINVEKYKDCSR